jgi:ADP-dependent NAD(P)H-hydrate dehydratase / NAD(P)H-hydrate epimerase
MKVVTADQMRTIEAAAFERGVTQAALMETAGAAVARAVGEQLGAVRAERILVLVGPGNNGGDGLVAARYLHDGGAEVHVYLLTPRPEVDPNLEAVRERDIETAVLKEDDVEGVLAPDLARADAVIDAVLGIGTQRPLSGVVAASFEALKTRRALLFAIDTPTGVDADSGEVDPHAAPADVTLALGFSKLGLHLLPGSAYAGELLVLDIGLDPSSEASVDIEAMTRSWVHSALPDRPLISNKGTFGRVLVVAGSQSYTGAATLACLGALRAGAGLVSLAAPAVVRAAAAAQLPEVTYVTLPEHEGDLAATAGDVAAQALPAYDVLVIGPGLGQSPGAQALVRGLLSAPAVSQVPAVIDADALNALAKGYDWHESLACRAVLTPHPGELGRLTRRSVADVQANRVDVARQCALEWKQTVVLKGAQTVIASPEGRVLISPFANAALAAAGTGDVLAGAIAGLQAQGVEPFAAAGLGVYLHGAAADLFEEEYGPSGILASELAQSLAKVAATIRRSR